MFTQGSFSIQSPARGMKNVRQKHKVSSCSIFCLICLNINLLWMEHIDVQDIFRAFHDFQLAIITGVLQIIILPFETEHLLSLRNNWGASNINNKESISWHIVRSLMNLSVFYKDVCYLLFCYFNYTRGHWCLVSIWWVTLHKTSIVFHCELIRIIWLISQSVAVATGEWEMQTLGRWCLFRWFRGREGAEGGFDGKVWLLTTERIYTLLL